MKQAKLQIMLNLKYMVLIIVGAITLLPFYWLIIASLMTPREIIAIPPLWYPTSPQWRNYLNVFKQTSILQYYKNSFIVASFITLFVLFTSSLAGYAFAKLRFTGKNLLFWFTLSTMMFPVFLFLAPVYYILRRFPLLGGNNIFGIGGSGALSNHLGLILPFIASGYSIFLMRQFIMTIPDELLDAARVDGASELFVLLRIVFPLIKPALATVALFTFINQWNYFLWPLIVTSARPYLTTIPVGILQMETVYRTLETLPLLMAGMVLQVVPPTMVFLILQKYYIRGIMFSGFGGL